MRAHLAAGLALALAAAACAEEAPPDEPIVVRRVGPAVEVRRTGVAIDVVWDRAAVTLDATLGEVAIAIDAVATGPGVPVTAVVTVGAATFAVRNDLVVIDDVTYRLGVWQERNQVVAVLAAGPIGPALVALAPYRTAIEAHLAEAAPVFAVVALFQAWPDGVEPPWPALDDPRDVEPPGHLAGDLVGLGMTCATHIRCPSSAPFCVTVDHGATYGVCTRACASDAACAIAGGRCAQPVIDIPDVPGAVLTCDIACVAGACPGLLACAAETATCEATER